MVRQYETARTKAVVLHSDSDLPTWPAAAHRAGQEGGSVTGFRRARSRKAARRCFHVGLGIQLERPDPPKIKFGFRANDGTQIDAAELPTVIALAQSIVQRFAVLPGP
jgi:hypothetical protein